MPSCAQRNVEAPNQRAGWRLPGWSLKAAGDRSAAKAALEQASADGVGMLADVGLAGWDNDADDAHPWRSPPQFATATDIQLDAETDSGGLPCRAARTGGQPRRIRSSREQGRFPKSPALLALRSPSPSTWEEGWPLRATAREAPTSQLRRRPQNRPITLMRAWDGPSQRALVALTKLYLTNGHAKEATTGGRPPAPLGTATEREARDRR